MTVTVRRISAGQASGFVAHFFNRLAKLDATQGGVLMIPAHGNLAEQWYAADRSDKPYMFTDYGLVGIGCDAGSTWGNDTGLGYAADGHAFLQGASGGAKAGKILVYATSMGVANALNYAYRHLSSISALALVCPVLDIEDIRANNRGGFTQASIETAYTNNAGWQAVRSGRNPIEFAAALATIPICIWYATDDPFVTTTSVANFVVAHGNTTFISMGAVGHTFSAAPPEDVAKWLALHA